MISVTGWRRSGSSIGRDSRSLKGICWSKIILQKILEVELNVFVCCCIYFLSLCLYVSTCVPDPVFVCLCAGEEEDEPLGEELEDFSRADEKTSESRRGGAKGSGMGECLCERQ